MTIANRSKALLFLCLVLACCFLWGCAEKTVLPDFTPLLSDEADSLAQREQTASLTKRIRIILPADGSTVLYQKSQELGEALGAKTGEEWSVILDGENLSPSPNLYDVILGWADHPDRRLWMEDLRRDDYICAFGAHSAVIGGLSEATTLQALEYFTEEALPSSTLEMLMAQGTVKLYRGEYPIDEVTWNGIPLYRWCIVYDEAEETEVRFGALALRETISERSGYVPEVMTEKQYDGSKQAIFLTASDPMGQRSGLRVMEQGIQLFANTSYGLAVASDYFTELLFEDEDGDGICGHTFAADQILFAEHRSFQLGTVVSPRFGQDGNLSSVGAVILRILAQKPDVLGITPMPDSSVEYFLQNIHTYQWTTERKDSGVVALGQDGEVATEVSGGNLSEQVAFIRRIGGERSGFFWVIASEGASLPAWLYEEELPILVTVYGQESGELSQEDADRLDVLALERISAVGEHFVCRCYGTPDVFSVDSRVWDEASGYWEIEAQRIS